MFRFLADENFNGKIVQGILQRLPLLDMVRVTDVGLSQSDDPSVLEWASIHDRIVLTHDRATMPLFARQRLSAGQLLPGLFVISNQRSVGLVIGDLELAVGCSQHAEWRNRIIYLPL